VGVTWNLCNLASIAIASYVKLNKKMHKWSIQKYFDYKGGDKTAKCRICNDVVEKASGSIDSLIDHLKGQHEEIFKIYDFSKRKYNLGRQQKKPTRDDNYDDEVNEGDREQPNASKSQTMMISFAEPVNVRKKPKKN
jgi:uncharacterized protein YijF (DUF1287 family)